MKNTFKFYALIWAIGFAIFSLITFLPMVSAEGAEITSSFIIGYIFCSLLFAEQLGCGYFVFKEENLQKVFYNIPIVKTSFSSLVVMIIASVVLSLIGVPNWLVAVICAVIASFSVVSVLKANFVSEEVAKIDEKIKAETFFIKNLTVDAETLISKATTDEAKLEAKKVYEAIRFSDPMSNNALASLESEITIKFKAFENAVVSGIACAETANELLILVEERNKKVKVLK
ncbi:MAG: hypothetical protein IKC01_05385 [Clostridia bacterium]|nr:hypothetical protein [Clostridia bacterium]